MTTPSTGWGDRFRASLPTREALAAHPWLKAVAPALLNPKLWHLQHESVARGVAVGTFWAFSIPMAQVVVAAFHCTRWQANIPVAAAMTMVTNPLTIGFWLWLAYQTGTSVMASLGVGTLGMVAAEQQSAGPQLWLTEFGWPTVVGMGMFAVGGAAVGYLGVKLVWRARVWFKRRGRR